MTTRREMLGVGLLPALFMLAGPPQKERASDGVGTRFSAFADFNGKRVLAAEGKDAILWNAETGKLLFRLQGHAGRVSAVALSPDGGLLATGGADDESGAEGDHEVILWNGATGKPLRRFRGQTSDVEAVRFSPDGARVLCVGHDGTARVFKTESGSEAYVKKDVTSGLGTVFSPDGRVVLAIQAGGVSAWDATTGKSLLRIEPPRPARPLRHIALASDLARVAGSDGGGIVSIWNARTGALERELPVHEGGVTDLLFTPDGRRVLTASGDGIIRIWTASNGAYVREMKNGGPVDAILLSPDGRGLFVKWGAAQGGNDEASQGATLWNATNGKETLRLTAKEAIFGRGLIGFSPTSRSFLLLNRPATIRGAYNGKNIRTLDLR